MSDVESIIITRLKRRARWRGVLALVGMLAGLPLSFLAALFLGTSFWLAGALLLPYQIAWSLWVGGMAAVTFPLLLYTEWRTCGDFMGEMARDVGPEAGSDYRVTPIMFHGGGVGLAVVASMITINPRARTAGIMELFLTGPRWLLSGWRHLRVARKLPAVDESALSTLVRRLLDRETGWTLDALTPHFESRDRLMDSLIWLAFYGWVGVSKGHDRIYIYSESRRFLT